MWKAKESENQLLNVERKQMQDDSEKAENFNALCSILLKEIYLWLYI